MSKLVPVPEDRIRLLTAAEWVDPKALSVLGSDTTRFLAIRMGYAIAEKLFEFNKVAQFEVNGRFLFYAEIKVIVPVGQPTKCPV